MAGFEKPLDAVITRLIEDDKNRHQKRVEMEMQQEKAEEEHLSKVMQPEVIPQKTRTHEQFMEDQIKHEQKRYERLKDIIVKEETSEMSMYRPSITKKTDEMAKKKRGDNVDVHERLHKEVKKEFKGDESTFQPKIDKKSVKMIQSKREKKIDEILVEDAKKRQERRSEMEKKFLEDQKLSKEDTQKAVSKRSQKFIFGRF